MIGIALGSKETLIVDVTDRLEEAENLALYNPQFDVYDEDDQQIITGDMPTVSGMQLRCVVDTAGWDIARYKLYVTFNTTSEIPRLGPLHFKVHP